MNLTEAPGNVPCLDVDPFSDEHISDPYPLQAMLRDAGPVVWLSKYGTYAVAQHEALAAVLSDTDHFISGAGVGLSDIRNPTTARPASPIAEADPPMHTAVRSSLGKILSPKVVRGWRERFDIAAEDLSDSLPVGETVDGVQEITEAFVYRVFPELLGVKSDPAKLRVVGLSNANAMGPPNARYLETQAQVEAIAGWYEQNQQRQNLDPDGFGASIYAAEETGELPEGSSPGLLRTFLRAGTDTTIAGLSSTLWLLAEHPEQWALLREEPTLISRAFEEALRLEAPSQTGYRTTVEGAEVQGLSLWPDTKVQLCLGAAGRDPRRWPEPDVFDIRRGFARHLSFGDGPHTCLGQMIARHEAEALIGALSRRFKTIRLAGEAEFRSVNVMRTLGRLPLVLD